MRTIWIVELPEAVPPLTLTSSPEQRDAWIEQGVAIAVYELDAAVFWEPVPTPHSGSSLDTGT